MANRIRRGPGSTDPETINCPVSGAFLPGSVVVQTAAGTEFDQATTAEARILILGNVEFSDQGPLVPYVADETAVAYRPRVEEEFQCIFAAATYARGEPLTVNASGQMAAAIATDTVIAFFDQDGGAIGANGLADVVIANSYVLA